MEEKSEKTVVYRTQRVATNKMEKLSEDVEECLGDIMQKATFMSRGRRYGTVERRERKREKQKRQKRGVTCSSAPREERRRGQGKCYRDRQQKQGRRTKKDEESPELVQEVEKNLERRRQASIREL
uniref:Uncharacterized protein n=1 Tax=Octopus bimaculoides TaxID=37653 RepID=A0A0L8FWF0_OCTBM